MIFILNKGVIVWKKEGRFAYLESLKNAIGRCVVPCNYCDIVNI